MNFCHKLSCVLSFDVVDRLTEDANTMMDKQKNKAECIRTMLADFVSANGIINNYVYIPRRERLEKYFGYRGYSGDAANTQRSDRNAGDGKCRCSFEITPDNQTEGLPNNVLGLICLQDNKACLIRELFLDFVIANGIIENYASIPEDERLRKFFGRVTRTTKYEEQSGRTVKIMRDKNIEVLQYYEGTRYLFSEVAYTAPDGITARVTVKQDVQQ